MDIRDNVFLITGGASGLGAGTARSLTQQGGKVVLADLNVAAGEALAAELGGVFVKCDVSREEDGQAAVAAAQALGTLRGLINCAGIAPACKTVGKDGPHALDLFAKAVNVNLIGTFNMIRLAAAAMAANAPLAIRQTIAAVHAGYDLPLRQALDLEASLFGVCCATEDKAEGTRAFLEKRPPAWKGR